MLFERRKFSRWIRKHHASNADLILFGAERVSKYIESCGFKWVEMDFRGFPSLVVAMEFEKVVSENKIQYLIIQFDKHGSLRFQVYFALRGRVEPYPWFRSGAFAKRQSDYFSAKEWGPHWYSFNKRRNFEKAWQKLETSIPHIIAFLDDGTPYETIRISA